jgi:peptide/nickel transport system substrate-binding protein
MRNDDEMVLRLAAGTDMTRRQALQRGTAAGLSLASVAAIFSACDDDSGGGPGSSPATGPGGEPQAGGTLQMALSDTSPQEGLDPQTTSTGSASALSGMLFTALVRKDSKFRLLPGLAESWEHDPDLTQWTFTLRTASFHDGTPFTAEDAAWTLTRIVDEEVASPIFARVSQSLTKRGIDAADDRTLRVTLKRPDALFPLAIANRHGGVVKAGTSKFDESTAIGTGPFALESFTPGQSWEVARFSQYFEEGLPYLDGVRQVVIKDTTALQASLLGGPTDFTDGLDLATATRLREDERVELLPASGLAYFVIMKQDEPPFTDPRVRLAVKLAANRQRVLDTSLRGFGSITGDVPVTMSDPTYPDAVGDRPQAIEEAQRLLAEAGHEDGLDLELNTAPFTPGIVDYCVVFAETVRSAGIRVNVQQHPADTYFTGVYGKRPFFVDFGFRRHASDMLSAFYAKDGVFNGSGFDADGRLSEVLDTALREADERRRNRIYTDALELVANESGMAIEAFYTLGAATKSRVKGDLAATDDPPAYDQLWIAA